DVLRVQRVGLVVREGAVQLEVHRDQVERQAFEDGRDRVAAHAVARVHDDLEPAVRGQVDEGAEVFGVGGEQVPLGDSALLLGRGEDAAGLGQFARGQVADFGEAGVLADRGGSGAAHLDAVVLGRVVAGGEHRAGQVEEAGGEVELVGRGQADLHHVGALAGRAAGEGPGQVRGGRA